ncbi:hypothetical protein Lal_00006050 [Lupinus albus]|nr:hypothetical protein Lal_00006050 [Lupinus albus]
MYQNSKWCDFLAGVKRDGSSMAARLQSQKGDEDSQHKLTPTLTQRSQLRWRGRLHQRRKDLTALLELWRQRLLVVDMVATS